MAVVAQKATIIANRDSTPTVLTDPSVSNGDAQDAMGYFPVANGDSIGSTYTLCQIPSNCRVTVLSLICDAITGAAANIGLYNPTKNGVAGTAISAAYFASAQTLATAIPNGQAITNQSGTNTIPNQQLPIWQAIGLSVDPGGYFDLTVTLTAAATAAGNVALRIAFIR